MDALLVPKNRKPSFRILLSIQDLTNVPLVSGLVHVRWHLQDSLRSETRGKTDRANIKEHKVEWGYESSWKAKMIVDKKGLLQDALLELQVYQEMYGGKERHALGNLILNLAEYASSEQEVSRRYLLQDSKVNSTLRLGIRMVQISGDTDFTTPALKKAQVFGGITGLLSESKDITQRDEDVAFNPASLSTEKAEALLSQDIHRNTLRRRWQAQAGELDPADVIEDIFNGGDGWAK
ncbi:N-terminal C2 in EEIG1 and EHBP1 proteins-domain-containing protein, partial [Protomyces lactucae-debilis]